MDSPFQIPDWYVYTAFGVVLLMGFIRLFMRFRNTEVDIVFADIFRNKYMAYCQSNGRDEETYNWLMFHSDKMQTNMGPLGIMEAFSPPFANIIHKHYPVIINLIPMIREWIGQDFNFRLHRETVNNLMRRVDDTLLQYMGVLDTRRTYHLKRMFNPLLWLSEGVSQVLSVPLLLLNSFGLMGAATVKRIESSTVVKLITLIAALIGAVAGAMSILSGWAETYDLFKGILDGSQQS